MGGYKMSLSIFLVPLAIAGTTALTASTYSVNIEAELSALNEKKVYYKVETKMKDEQLLQETLRNYGSETSHVNKHVESIIGDVQITFYKEENGTFSAIFHEEIDVADAEQFVNNIFEEYTRVVQQQTYEKLMERATREGLIFESENREEDTITLTFQVKE